MISIVFFPLLLISCAQEYAQQEDYTLVTDDTYTPFSRHLKQSGIIIGGLDGVDDDFLNNIGTTVASMFSSSESIDTAQQQSLIEKMRTLHVFQRVGIADVHDDPENASFHAHLDGYDDTMDNVEAVDFIWKINQNQGGEVFEHILHTITAIGFTHSFSNEWNYEEEDSLLRQAMEEAINQNYYDVSSYEEIRNTNDPESEKDYLRITTQEFAYWMIASAWDYYPTINLEPQDIAHEWSGGSDLSELEDNLPLAYELYMTTVYNVLVPPNPELFISLFGE
jgi:hypothetical protein